MGREGRGVEKLPSAPPGAGRTGGRAAAKMMKERERDPITEISAFPPSLFRSRSTSAVNDHFREDNLPCRPPTQSYKRRTRERRPTLLIFGTYRARLIGGP